MEYSVYTDESYYTAEQYRSIAPVSFPRSFEAEIFNQLDLPKLDERWIIEIEGNQFVKYAGLLDLGHQKGISQIEVEPLQFPTKDNGNAAICKAAVISRVGETFIDIGDANPGNCSSKVVKHLFRLASTRAIARALRSFTNIGMSCLEELSDISDVIPRRGRNPATGYSLMLKPRKVVTFKCSGKLRRKINGYEI